MAASRKKQKLHGGARKGAGRKPVLDPKKQILIYVETSIVNAAGGIDPLRNEIYAFLHSKKWQ